MSWATEYLAAAEVYDFAQDPDDFRVTRQSKVTVSGLLVPVTLEDGKELDALRSHYEEAYEYARNGLPLTDWPFLTYNMRKSLERASIRSKGQPISDFDYISIDPREYTIFEAPDVGVPIISIHTQPESCWFLGVLRFEGALGLSLGRMRVMRPNENGMYPVTILTKWRALTNKVKQEEVRSAYRRLVDPTL